MFSLRFCRVNTLNYTPLCNFVNWLRT